MVMLEVICDVLVGHFAERLGGFFVAEVEDGFADEVLWNITADVFF